jgi:hypothetical protein
MIRIILMGAELNASHPASRVELYEGGYLETQEPEEVERDGMGKAVGSCH